MASKEKGSLSKEGTSLRGTEKSLNEKERQQIDGTLAEGVCKDREPNQWN